MGTSSANPGELDGYVADLGPPIDSVTRARGTFEDALLALRSQLEGRTFDVTVSRAPLARVRTLDETLTTVAQRFRAADSGPGVVTVADDALGVPLAETFSERRIDQLAEEAADEYANLAEDDGDPTTNEELAGYLEVIDAEIAAAGEGLPPLEAFEAEKVRAAELLAAAGPRDVRTALEMIQGDIEDGGVAQERGEAILADLGVFTSLGLEDDPIRAQEWMATLQEEWDWDSYHGDDHERGELLALLATQVDTRTRTLGELVFWRIFEDPLPTEGNELLEAVAGDSSAFTVMFEGFADSARLANAIVDRGITMVDPDDPNPDTLGQRWLDLIDAQYEGFENGGDGTGDDSEDDRYQRALAGLLAAATDESLLPEERTATALGLLQFLEDASYSDDRWTNFSAPVIETIGLTIDPLLDAWLAGTSNQLRVPGDPPIDLPPEAFDLLQRTLDRIAQSPEASQGLMTVLTDFTQDQIRAAVAAGNDRLLSDMAGILHAVVGGGAGSRYDALVSSVEGGGAEAGVTAFAVELLSLVKFANIGTLAKAGYRGLTAYYGSDVPSGGGLVPGFYTGFIRSELLLAHLDAGTIDDPALAAALEDVATEGGYPAIDDLLLHPEDLADRGVSAATIAELEDLEEVIEEQKQRIQPETLAAIDEIFSQ